MSLSKEYEFVHLVVDYANEKLFHERELSLSVNCTDLAIDITVTRFYISTSTSITIWDINRIHDLTEFVNTLMCDLVADIKRQEKDEEPNKEHLYELALPKDRGEVIEDHFFLLPRILPYEGNQNHKRLFWLKTLKVRVKYYNKLQLNVSNIDDSVLNEEWVEVKEIVSVLKFDESVIREGYTPTTPVNTLQPPGKGGRKS